MCVCVCVCLCVLLLLTSLQTRKRNNDSKEPSLVERRIKEKREEKKDSVTAMTTTLTSLPLVLSFLLLRSFLPFLPSFRSFIPSFLSLPSLPSLPHFCFPPSNINTPLTNHAEASSSDSEGEKRKKKKKKKKGTKVGKKKGTRGGSLARGRGGGTFVAGSEGAKRRETVLEKLKEQSELRASSAGLTQIAAGREVATYAWSETDFSAAGIPRTRWARFKRWSAFNKKQIFWVTLYCIVNCILAAAWY